MSPRVVVAGGGPTGLATAICAAREGMQVQVVEPRDGIIDKACGEGLMPAGVDALERLGVDPTALGRPFRGIRYIDGTHVAQADFSHGPGLGVRRLALHGALREVARRVGVETVHARVRSIDQDDQSVQVHLDSGETLPAHWLFAADGLHSSTRRGLGLDLPPVRTKRIGLRRHFAVAPWSDFVEVYWHPDVEAYVTPVGPELVGVAMLVTGKLPAGTGQSPFDRLLSRFPALEARLTDVPFASQTRGAGPFETRVAHRVAGRVLLVGDAAGYLDPLTGEGLKLGFLGAEAAVAAVAAGQPDRWERDWRRITRRYYWGTLGLLVLTGQPTLRSWMVPTVERAPWILGGALRFLG